MLTFFGREKQRRDATLPSAFLISHLLPDVRPCPALLSWDGLILSVPQTPRCFKCSSERLIQFRLSLWLRQTGSAGNVNKWGLLSFMVISQSSNYDSLWMLLTSCPRSPTTGQHTRPPTAKVHGAPSSGKLLLHAGSCLPPPPAPADSEGQKTAPCFKVVPFMHQSSPWDQAEDSGVLAGPPPCQAHTRHSLSPEHLHCHMHKPELPLGSVSGGHTVRPCVTKSLPGTPLMASSLGDSLPGLPGFLAR